MQKRPKPPRLRSSGFYLVSPSLHYLLPIRSTRFVRQSASRTDPTVCRRTFGCQSIHASTTSHRRFSCTEITHARWVRTFVFFDTRITISYELRGIARSGDHRGGQQSFTIKVSIVTTDEFLGNSGLQVMWKWRLEDRRWLCGLCRLCRLCGPCVLCRMTPKDLSENRTILPVQNRVVLCPNVVALVLRNHWIEIVSREWHTIFHALPVHEEPRNPFKHIGSPCFGIGDCRGYRLKIQYSLHRSPLKRRRRRSLMDSLAFHLLDEKKSVLVQQW